MILFSVIWDSDRVNKPAFDIVVLRLAIVKLLMEIIESINGLSIGAIAPNSIINGDCFEVMKLIPDKSIDLILCDPPYYKMKEEKWDRQWKTATDFLNWLDAIAEQWQRILKPNGSLYCFASAKMSSQVEMKLAERFNVINRLTWIKSDIDVNAGGIHRLINKKTLTSFYPNTESIIFCEHRRENSFAKIYDAKCDGLRGAIFEPVRSYLEGEREKSGISFKQIATERGCTEVLIKQRHFSSCQWKLPSQETYSVMQQMAIGYFTRTYDDLRRECDALEAKYKDLKQQFDGLRRTFSVTSSVPYTDIWTFPVVKSRGKHTCQKPVEMLEHIIRTSSRKNDVILDSFAGHGSTAIAAINTDRKYICIEIGKQSFENMANRIKNQGLPVKTKSPKRLTAKPKGQLNLF